MICNCLAFSVSCSIFLILINDFTGCDEVFLASIAKIQAFRYTNCMSTLIAARNIPADARAIHVAIVFDHLHVQVPQVPMILRSCTEPSFEAIIDLVY